MNWLSKLFKKKISETASSGNKWLEGHRLFQKGKQFYLNRQSNEALSHFDKAIENGYEDDVYGLRAGCLQELGYDYDAIEDFNKAIALAPDDCNKYYSRSISKGAILDFEGQIFDLEKAIELSKGNNDLNRAYNEEAIKMGHKNGLIGMFEMDLIRAKMNLDSEIADREIIENSPSEESKVMLQKMREDWRVKRLKGIKRREV